MSEIRPAVRIAAGATAVVALASAVMSWDALQWGAGQLGVDPHLTWLYPVAVDGTIVVGTTTALALRRVRLRLRAYVWAVLGAAIAISVVGNAAHGAGADPLHRVGAAVPAAALAASLHLLVVLVRSVGAAPARSGSGAESGAAPAPSRRRSGAARARVQQLLREHGAGIDADLVARRAGVTRKHALKLLREEARPRAIGGEQ